MGIVGFIQELFKKSNDDEPIRCEPGMGQEPPTVTTEGLYKEGNYECSIQGTKDALYFVEKDGSRQGKLLGHYRLDTGIIAGFSISANLTIATILDQILIYRLKTGSCQEEGKVMG